jgi:hypothetical protein
VANRGTLATPMTVRPTEVPSIVSATGPPAARDANQTPHRRRNRARSTPSEPPEDFGFFGWWSRVPISRSAKSRSVRLWDFEKTLGFLAVFRTGQFG